MRWLILYLFHLRLSKIWKISRFVRKKLIATIEKLEESPQFYGKRLQNISLWSLRSGKYRIIFEIDDKSEEVRIHAIGHRKKVYRKL